MPNKYSHSVVLAQHSSRGLIDLPNDQYVNYWKSSPLLTTTRPAKRPSSRAPSVKTATSSRPSTQHSNIRQQRIPEEASGTTLRSLPHNDSRQTHQRRVILSDSEFDREDELSNVERSPELGQTGGNIRSISSERLPQDEKLPRKRSLNSRPLVRDESSTQSGQRLQRAQAAADQAKTTIKPDFIVSKIPRVASEPFENKGRQPLANVPTLQISSPDGLMTKHAAKPQTPSTQQQASIPERAHTPQQSSAGTTSTHRDIQTPPTPLSTGQLPPRMSPLKQGPDLKRVNTGSSEKNEIFNPAVMPTSPDFTDFSDAYETRSEYIQPFLGSSSAPRVSHKDKKQRSRPAPTPRSQSALGHSAAGYRDRLDSLSSLSSFEDIGVLSILRSPAQSKRNSKQISMRAFPGADGSPGLPSIPHSSFKSQFDSYLMDDTRLSSRASGRTRQDSGNLREFLGSLEYRFGGEEETMSESDSAAVPPNISKYRVRNGVENPLEQLEQMMVEQTEMTFKLGQAPMVRSETPNGSRGKVQSKNAVKEKNRRSLFGKLTGKRTKLKGVGPADLVDMQRG